VLNKLRVRQTTQIETAQRPLHLLQLPAVINERLAKFIIFRVQARTLVIRPVESYRGQLLAKTRRAVEKSSFGDKIMAIHVR